MRHISLIIFILFLSLILSTEATYSASLYDKINKEKLLESEKLIQEGKDRKATFILEGVFRSDNRSIRQEAAVKLARIYRKEDKLDEALSYLKEFIDISQYEEYPSIEDYPILEAGLLYNAKGECLKALRLFDYMGKNNASGMKTVLAAEGCGDSFLLMKYYGKSASYYTYALRYMNTTIMPRYFTEKDKKDRNRIAKKLKDAQRLYDIDMYGEGFVLYREAENARRRHKNYGVAIEKYKEIIKLYPGTVYAEASEFYTNLCLLELDRIKEAEKGLIKFYERLPIGLYRGEALKTLGDIELEYRQNCNKAEEWYSKALKWAEDISKTDKELESYEVPNKAKEVTRPPVARQGRDKFGNVVDNKIGYGNVINRKTCYWYLSDLKRQCHLKLGFIEFVEDDMDSALKHFKKVLEYDKYVRAMQNNNQPNTYKRLILCCKKGTFRGSKKEIEQFRDKKRRVMVMLAEFYHVCLEYQKSEELYQKLYKGDYGKLSKGKEAYVAFGLAYCRYHQFDFKKAVEYLEGFKDKYRGTPTEAWGLFSLADCLNRVGEKEECLECWKKIYKRFPDTYYGQASLYYLGWFSILDGKKKEGAKYLKEFVRKYPNSKLCPLAKYTLKERGL